MRNFKLAILGLAIAGMGIFQLLTYFGQTEQDRLHELQQLVAEGDTTIALLEQEYVENTKNGVTEDYEITYKFKVDDQDYFIEKNVDELPSEDEYLKQIIYLSSDPNINSEDPQSSLDKITEKSGNNTYLFLGIGGIIVGLIILFFVFRPKKKD